jgi:hypothetical protein
MYCLSQGNSKRMGYFVSNDSIVRPNTGPNRPQEFSSCEKYAVGITPFSFLKAL